MRRSPNAVDGVVICGAPRSGTSMLAECFARAGLDPGADLIPASESNPHGFFEDLTVNRLNDRLLESAVPVLGQQRPPRSLWWLAAFEPLAPSAVGDDVMAAVRHRIPTGGFVLKDPRFSYTYPFWRTALPSHVVVVVVRRVDEVRSSLMAMRDRSPDEYRGCQLGPDSVESMWRAIYGAIEEWADDRTVYVTADSVRDGSVLPLLSERCCVDLSVASIVRTFHRERTRSAPSDAERRVFARCSMPS